MRTNGNPASRRACCQPLLFHGIDPPAAIGEYPDRVQAALRFDDRPGHVVEDCDMSPFGLEGLGRDDEDTPAYFGDGELPTPLQAADVAVAQAGVDRK